VSFTGHQWDPPDTATGVLDEEEMGVVEGWRPEGVTLDALELALELELEAGVAGEVAVVPGLV
jgi:hypothetical protein